MHEECVIYYMSMEEYNIYINKHIIYIYTISIYDGGNQRQQ